MSNSFWQGILVVLKKIIADIEAELSKIVKTIGDVINAVVSAEESQIMTDFIPTLKQLAISIQDTSPGLPAKDFIAELVAAAISILEQEGITLAHTALTIAAATVAHDLGIGDQTGNQGTVG